MKDVKAVFELIVPRRDKCTYLIAGMGKYRERHKKKSTPLTEVHLPWVARIREMASGILKIKFIILLETL